MLMHPPSSVTDCITRLAHVVWCAQTAKVALTKDPLLDKDMLISRAELWNDGVINIMERLLQANHIPYTRRYAGILIHLDQMKEQ